MARLNRDDDKLVGKGLYLILFASLLLLFFATGGMVVTIYEFSVDSIVKTVAMLVGIDIVALSLVILCSRKLLARNGDPTSKVREQAGVNKRKEFLFSLILFCLIVATTLILLNVAASFYTVKWPMSGLHGVSSEVGKKAWEYHKDATGFVGVNSWGQRDGEHALRPQPGSYRVIFLGDSFLDDAEPIPFPVRTGDYLAKMGRASYEVINLGVSATAPDEYYFRLKQIGLPLHPRECVLVFTSCNDFIQEPSLLSYAGISATYPRRSFLQLLGLNSLDQVISNERRPILRAWFKGGSLLKHELELQEIFGKTKDDLDTENTYLSFFPPNEQAQLRAVLSNSSPAARQIFYEMLRQPDENKFRSYYLDVATKLAKGMPVPNFIGAEYSFRWVKAAYELCNRNGIKFTLVVIPDGFTVDSRIVACYAAVADMQAYMKHLDEAVDRLLSHAKMAGMHVVDLREPLRKHPGSYLNMDGHWSQLGVDVSAEYLAGKLSGKSP